MEKINWNNQRNLWKDEMSVNPIWEKGTDAQQEFADTLVEKFCERFAKYLCWAVKDELLDMVEADFIVDHIFYAISEIDDSRWWCNKKNMDEFSIAIKLLDDYEDEISLVKKMKKQYN